MSACFLNCMTEAARGKLKIFMGYAAGVGKTYKMLDEAQERKKAGVDVVIGYFEPHGRLETIAKTDGLETIPRKTMGYRGCAFEEMDTAAILARHPALCVVDEFPHTNIPGSERAKRWEDVETLLAAGIDVLTTMNVQHLDSLNDQVWQISGIRVQETVPDWVVEQAAEVVMIDLTPRALLHRLERGVVYERTKAERALENFFRESTLVALRELALRQTAHEVEQRILNVEKDAASPNPAQPRHRILILVEASPKSRAPHPPRQTRERFHRRRLLRRHRAAHRRSQRAPRGEPRRHRAAPELRAQPAHRNQDSRRRDRRRHRGRLRPPQRCHDDLRCAPPQTVITRRFHA